MHRVLVALSVAALALSLLAAAPGGESAGTSFAPDVDAPEDIADEAGPAASGFLVFKLPTPQPACSGLAFGVTANPYFSRDDCGFADFELTNAGEDPQPQVVLRGPDDEVVDTLEATDRGGGTWRFSVQPDTGWPAGRLVAEVQVDGESIGQTMLFLNMLGADVTVAEAEGGAHSAGDPLAVSGRTYQLDATTDVIGAEQTDVPATFELAVATADGGHLGTTGPVTSDGDGSFTATIPKELTANLDVPAGSTLQVSVKAVEATYDDPATGEWSAAVAGVGHATFAAPADTPVLHNEFVSSTGWVKPGEAYPSRVVIENTTGAQVTDLEVVVTAPAGTRFVGAEVLDGAGTAAVTDTTVNWSVETLATGDPVDPAEVTMVVTAEAASSEADPRVVWKDLSTAATLTVGDDEQVDTAASHGPKVIPPEGAYETARYGDKPFPIVPVEYTDRSRQPSSNSSGLDRAVNDADFPGSMFNLYQEMSYGQLYPQGAIPSAGIAQAGFDYEPGFDFTDPEVGTNRDCRGATFGQDGIEEQTIGSPVYPDRIVDGWYQLPGTTEYYGGDFPAFALGVVGTIDSACGQLGKGVYDAAQISDPEIDYDQFDSDKDGVVDFFMLVFNGCGGNGGSQVPVLCPYDNVPYDNIWPHSSSLEMQYTDPETGLRGYVTDDQLTSHTGVPQCWVDEQYLTFDDCAANGGSGNDDLPTFVRVGPYNVNPETAIDSASVISHEYGHHLDLPDFYSSYQAYADFNLMAADFSQHLTVFSKQELGWVVPEPIQPDEMLDVQGWQEIKHDTGEIHWQTPDGTPYTLSAANGDQNIHNGQAYRAGLPPRVLLGDEARPEGDEHVWYSGRGNDFGCAPTGAHNLDVSLPELADAPDGAEVTLEFSSSWDIEWDWDYGFVLTSPDGANYTSQPSEQGYTTSNVFNPNSQQCFTELDNGLTGTSTAYEQGEPFVTTARAAAEYTSADDPFLTDTYDISELAGTGSPVVRFSYFTDAAFDRPGWFIDDIRVLVDGEEVYTSDFEGGAETERLFPGGCNDDVRVAAACTAGWTRIAAGAGAALDHAYYLELRDQSGFDYDGHGQSDRGDTSWDPGLLIEYTDEAHGYGNNGVPQPPAQHYLDSQPSPGEDCGARTNSACGDASFTDRDGDTTFSDAINADTQPEGWIDSFNDPDSEYGDGLWHFDYGCLTAEVNTMEGAEIGPAPTTDDPNASDLVAGVTLTGDGGCEPFTYGRSGPSDDNTAPLAVAVAEPTEAWVGQTVTVDGTGSSDAETPDELTFDWELGDGTTATGATVEHAYAEAGTYKAVLTVTDPDGASDTASVTVTVTDPVRIECDDPAVVRSDGWQDRESSDATGGRYCRGAEPRGQSPGDHLEVDFTGDRIDLEYGFGPAGTSADVFIDGERAGTVSFRGDGSANTVTFGQVATFDDLGEGPHTFRLEVTATDGRQRWAYVDSLVADGFGESTGQTTASAEGSSPDQTTAADEPSRSGTTADGAVVGAGGETSLARAAGGSAARGGLLVLSVLLLTLAGSLHTRRWAARDLR